MPNKIYNLSNQQPQQRTIVQAIFFSHQISSFYISSNKPFFNLTFNSMDFIDFMDSTHSKICRQ